MQIQMSLPLMQKAAEHQDSVAIIDEKGRYTYNDLMSAAAKVAYTLLGNESSLQEGRVAFMIPSSFEYVVIQWGIWLAGGVALPISPLYPLPRN